MERRGAKAQSLFFFEYPQTSHVGAYRIRPNASTNPCGCLRGVCDTPLQGNWVECGYSNYFLSKQSTHENGCIKPRKTFWRNSKQLLNYSSVSLRLCVRFFIAKCMPFPKFFVHLSHYYPIHEKHEKNTFAFYYHNRDMFQGISRSRSALFPPDGK